MARINTYKNDENVSINDKLLGTDKDSGLKPTRNYTIKDIRDLILDGVDVKSQDNVPVSITLPQILEPSLNSNVLVDASDLINNADIFSVNSVEIPFFTLRRGSRIFVLAFQGLGKGDYGLGTLPILPSNLQIISEKNLNLDNIENSSTTTTINLFNIGSSEINEIVNILEPPIEIKPISQGFTVFLATQNGEEKAWVYNGDSGTFGLNASKTSLSDFNQISTTTQTTGEAFLEEDVPTNIEVGASKANTLIPEGTSFTDYVKLVHQNVFNPTFVNPQFSLTRGSLSLRIAGSLDSFNLTYNFNRGSILGNIVGGIWNPYEFQNPRAGEAISFVINGVSNGTSNVLSLVDYEVLLGVNTFNGSVTFAQGVQPLNSEGNAFGSPFPSGTESRTAMFEGVYPLFGTTTNINTLTQQPLISMIGGNLIEFSLVDETDSNKQTIEIPDAWLSSRPLQSIQYFNSFSGQWDTSNKISDFAVTSVNKTISSNSVGYKRYTHIGARRIGLLIRIIF